jgi:hypothetical protein
MNKEVEILKIGSIIPRVVGGKINPCYDEYTDAETIMVVFNGGPLFDHYVVILKEKCGDKYKYLKTHQSIVGTPDIRPDRFSKLDKKSNTLKGIQNDDPVVGQSYGIGSWYTSTVHKIIDDDILLTRNSVYAIHNVEKIRDKKLNDLGIN